MTGWRAAHGSGKDNEKEEEKRGNKYEDQSQYVSSCLLYTSDAADE